MKTHSERIRREEEQVVIRFTGWQLIGWLALHAVVIGLITLILGYVRG